MHTFHPEGRILIVGHVETVKAAYHVFLRQPADQPFPMKLTVGNASLTTWHAIGPAPEAPGIGRWALASHNDAAHLADVGRHIGASYWLTTTEDYGLTDSLVSGVLQKRQRQLLAGAPVVYQNKEGDVQLYDVRSLLQIEENVRSPAQVRDRKNDSRPLDIR